MIALAFNGEEAQAASEAWRFNCGPGSLCALTGKSPEDARQALPQFEQRGYTNRHTHWVAADGAQVFDINNIHFGGWLSIEEWAGQLIPWLIRECAPKATGAWLDHAFVGGQTVRKRIAMERGYELSTGTTIYALMLPALIVSTRRPGRRKRAHPGVRRELVELLLQEMAKRLR